MTKEEALEKIKDYDFCYNKNADKKNMIQFLSAFWGHDAASTLIIVYPEKITTIFYRRHDNLQKLLIHITEIITKDDIDKEKENTFGGFWNLPNMVKDICERYYHTRVNRLSEKEINNIRKNWAVRILQNS